VCHLAVDVGTEVLVRRVEQGGASRAGVVDLRVPAFGDRYRFALARPPGRHPLLEAALRRWGPPGGDLQVTVASPVPPGSGLGTSASVVVALVAAVQALVGNALDPALLARAAHEVETVDVGLQSGVQDQIAAAYGGSNLVTIDRYPDVDVRALDVAPATWDALGRRLVTVYLGAPHRSSAVHEAVIAHLTSGNGPRLLAPLRAAARIGDITVYCSDTLHRAYPPTLQPRKVIYTSLPLTPLPGDQAPGGMPNSATRESRAGLTSVEDRIEAADSGRTRLGWHAP